MLITPQMIMQVTQGLKADSNLSVMTLKDYLEMYRDDILHYYDLETWTPLEEEKRDTTILCLVDHMDLIKPRKRSPRRAGKERRDRYKHRYTYANPLNRIHGYIILEDTYKNNKDGRKVVSISLICSSRFGRTKHVGSDLMRYAEALIHLEGYTDIVLEVANEFAATGHDEEHDDEDQDYEDDTDDEDDEDDTDDEDDEDDADAEDDDEYEPLIDELAHEFWRKTMRMVDDAPYYNVGADYIRELICTYIYDYSDNSDSYADDAPASWEDDEDYEPEKGEEVEASDTSYGGYWYKKGKASQSALIKFYESFGYVESPIVHKVWKCFSSIPYPTYLKVL